MILFATALPAAMSAEIVRLAGSDLAAPALAGVMAAASPGQGIDWKVDLKGTKPGLDALRAGTADATIVLLESLPSTRDPALEYTPLAYRAPAILVSAGNPLSQITLSALSAVLGEGETENYKRWSELGLPGDWSARTISISVASVEDPLLLDFLRFRVLKSPRLKSSIVTGAPAAALLTRLREDDSAIGIFPSIPADMTGLRAVPVALNAGGIGFGPTSDNVHAGDYPMRMILAVARVRDGGGPSEEAVRALLSDRVAQALASHGFVPVPAGMRARLAAAVGAP
jgi:hypothetical protein